MIKKLSMFTEYGQFFIADRNANGDTSNENFWSDDAFNDRLAIEDGIIGVSIENDEAVANIEIELLKSKEAENDLSEFDHVVEGSLQIKSGKLQIQDCPTSQVELELEVEPGWYRVRVCSSNLEKAYQEHPEDYYFIKIWKESFSQKDVIKRKKRAS
jgi:hypothetical protein